MVQSCPDGMQSNKMPSSASFIFNIALKSGILVAMQD